MASKDVQQRPFTEVSEEDEPSARWGWHGRLPRGSRLLGWFAALSCFGMIIGNHKGNVENIYLVVFGVAIVGMLVYAQVRERTSWRR